MGVRNLSGRQISESNLENPNSISGGLIQGGLQFGLEIGKATVGVATVPMKRVREQGPGCATITKGTIQGLVGLLCGPIGGVLRCVRSSA